MAANLVSDSLALIESCGTQAVDAHVTRLAEQLATGLEQAGARVPRQARGPRSHIVCIDMGQAGARVAALHQALAADGVRVGVHGRMLRFSIHFYNDEADIRRAAASAARWFSRQG